MGDINFKSVGQTRVERKTRELRESPVVIGIKTPLRPGFEKGIFDVNYNLADQQHDNLRNLLLTNWGERLGLYDFGANLRPLLADFVSLDDFDSKAVERINGAVARWMPFISLDNYVSEVDRSKNTAGLAAISITITYNIPSLQVTGRMLQLILYAM
jgi:phage baseplate assembly protein W